jgi:hypothetical protein
VVVVPTLYKGIKYRSRTEARWAVVFDELGWHHLYEPESYRLPSALYLPDFYLPQFDRFFEVKGLEPTGLEERKAEELCLFTGKDVLLTTGPPNPNRKEWSEDIITFNYWELDDGPYVDVQRGGFVSRRRDTHPACSIHFGNLVYQGSLLEIGWQTAFRKAANMRFGIFED